MATQESDLKALVDSLAAQAAQRDVPTGVVRAATLATIAALGGGRFTQLTRRRAAAYFTAVVHRRLVRNHGGSTAAARLVAQTVVDDLMDCGLSAQMAVSELERGWKTQLPATVIDEYRSRLCA